jgi:uncharacterized membrane protein (DUF373 family)
MDSVGEKPVTRLAALADKAFLNVEVLAYIMLAFLLATSAALGIWNAAMLLFAAIRVHADSDALVLAIDRLLFVLMVVEILHTVRVSFRSGTLVAEPFLVVGLIASIRRVLVITLESSQANQLGKWTPEAQVLLHSTMLELAVLGGLILVLVVSIFLMRWNRRQERRM